MHMECLGQGSPAVILEHDIGGTLWSMDWLLYYVSNFTRVCSYSRAGYGYSSLPGTRTRTATQAAVEFRYLTQAANIDEFVYVAHGHGAHVIRTFHARFEPMIVGLMFIDGKNPRCEALCTSAATGDNSAERLVQSALPTGIPRALDLTGNWQDPLGLISHIPSLRPTASGPLHSFLLTSQFWQAAADEIAYGPVSCDQTSRLAVGHRYTPSEVAGFDYHRRLRRLDNNYSIGGSDWGYDPATYALLKQEHHEFIPTSPLDKGSRQSHDANSYIEIPVTSIIPEFGIYNGSLLCGFEFANMTQQNGRAVFIPGADHLNVIMDPIYAKIVANEIMLLVNTVRYRLSKGDLDNHHSFESQGTPDDDNQHL